MPVSVERTPTKRPRAADQIRDAAQLLIAREGFHVGVDTITAASGRTKQTLYTAYGSKAGLITAVLDHAHETWNDDIAPLTDTSPVDAFTALTTARALHAESLFVRALTELPADEPGHAAARAHVQAVTDLLTACARHSGRTDPEATARRLVLLLHGAVAQLRAGKAPGAAASDAREAAAAILSA